MTRILDAPSVALFQFLRMLGYRPQAIHRAPRMATSNIGKEAEATTTHASMQGTCTVVGSTTEATSMATSMVISDVAATSASPLTAAGTEGEMRAGELTQALPVFRTEANSVQSPSPPSGPEPPAARWPGELAAALNCRVSAGAEVPPRRRVAAESDAATTAMRPEPYRPFNRMPTWAGPYAVQLQARANRVTPTGAAVNHAGTATAPAVPPLRGYVGRTRLVCTRLKIQGAHPADVPEGYEERIAAVLAAADLQLEGVYIRPGCIELIVDARSMGRSRRRAAADYSPGARRARLDAHLQPPSRHGAGRASATSAAEMASSAPAACSVNIASNCLGLTSSPTSAPISVPLCGSQHPTKLRTQRSSLPLVCDNSGSDSSSSSSSSGDYSSPVWREVPHLLDQHNGFIGEFSTDSDDNGGSSSGRLSVVDVGELIRALKLPCDGLTLEHSSTQTLCEEPEVPGPWALNPGSVAAVTSAAGAAVMAAGAAVPLPTDLGLVEGGSQRIGGLVAPPRRMPGGMAIPEVPAIQLAPPTMPQLLSVSPRVLLTRSCRSTSGATTTTTTTTTATNNSDNDNHTAITTSVSVSGGNTASSGGGGGSGGGQHSAASSSDTVELVLLISCTDDRVPELLFRSQSSYLPATVTGCVLVGSPVGAGGQGFDILICTITLPVAMLPDEPGLLVAEVRWDGHLQGSAMPLLLVDDAEVGGELQAAVEDWRGSLVELEDILLDLACFFYHARRLRPRTEAPPTAAGGARGRQAHPPMPAEGAVVESLPSLHGPVSDVYDMYDGTPAAVVRGQVSELGLHMATWMASCPAGWTRILTRIRTDLASLGVSEVATLGVRHHHQSPYHQHLQQHQQAFRQDHQDLNHDEQQEQQQQQQSQQRRRRGGGSGNRGGAAVEDGYGDNGDDVRNADNRKASTAAAAPVGRGGARPVFAGNLDGGSGASSGLSGVTTAAASLLLASSAAVGPAPVPGSLQQTPTAIVASPAQLQQQGPQYSSPPDGSLHATGEVAMVGGYLAWVAAPTAAVAAAATGSAPLRYLAGADETIPESGSGSVPAPSSAAAFDLPRAIVSQPGHSSMQAQTLIPSSVCCSGDPCVGEQAYGKPLNPWVITMGLSHSSPVYRKPVALASALVTAAWARVQVCGVDYSCLMAADYQAFVADYTIHLTQTRNIVTLSCLLLLAIRTWLETTATTAATAGDARILFLRTMVPPAVSCLPSCVSMLSRPFLSRGAWQRLLSLMRLPQLLAFCVGASLIAWGGFPAAAAIRSYELGASAFISDGIVHIVASMLLPIPVLLVSLLRMPVHMALWTAVGAPFGTRWAAVRAAAVACLSVITSICWHTYLHGVYRRRRWACGSTSSAQQQQQQQQQQQAQQHAKTD
ncbi:hypothetical protein Vretimale_4000 [Volvox reticuliferus]|nr:hypothetical protein Vretifemale_2662 [Volvox reticuliferus]GIL98805.1 hypothetical protein Vretimale_4000 [Volvox reticuliferus]